MFGWKPCCIPHHGVYLNSVPIQLHVLEAACDIYSPTSNATNVSFNQDCTASAQQGWKLLHSESS